VKRYNKEAYIDGFALLGERMFRTRNKSKELTSTEFKAFTPSDKFWAENVEKYDYNLGHAKAEEAF